MKTAKILEMPSEDLEIMEEYVMVTDWLRFQGFKEDIY